MALPYFKLSGSPYDQGFAQGQQLRQLIAHNLELYFRRFKTEAGLESQEVLNRAERYLSAISGHSAAYLEGVQGIADGGGFDLLAIGALNVRYEIMYHQFAHDVAQLEAYGVDGCTAFALMPPHSADGSLWMGQNWDWIAGVKGAVIHSQDEDGSEVLSFTEAGIFGGKIGLNGHGLGLCINGLVSAQDNWERLGQPVHLRTYNILRCKTLEAARKAATLEPRSGSVNFLIAQGQQAVDLEIAPQGVIAWQDERQLVHANHFVDPARAGIELVPIEWLDRSSHRQGRLEAALSETEKPGLEDLQTALRDREGAPYAVCRTPGQEELELGEPYETVASVVMNLSSKELWISDGPPHQNEYQRFGI
jgi:isopenicillin-N N-acyltransferase-like protein